MGLGIAQACFPRQLAVGRGRSPIDRAHGLVEHAAERIDAGEVHRNGGEVDPFAGQIAGDVRDRRLHPWRRIGRAGARRLRRQPPLGRRPIGLRKLHAGQPALAPGDAAGTDGGVEQAMVNLGGPVRHWTIMPVEGRRRV